MNKYTILFHCSYGQAEYDLRSEGNENPSEDEIITRLIETILEKFKICL